MVVKNADSKRRKTMKQCYLSLKVGKNSFHFTADSFRELKEWCALIRQAMDNGNFNYLFFLHAYSDHYSPAQCALFVHIYSY